MILTSSLVPFLSSSLVFQRLMTQVRAYEPLDNLSLPRAARLAVTAALHLSLNEPVLLLTDRADHALTLVDELSLWLPDTPILRYREPTPLFYEDSPWSETTRRDRLNVLTTLAAYHIPGALPPQATTDTPWTLENAEGRSDLSREETRRQIWNQLRGVLSPIKAPIIVAPVRAVMARTLPRREFIKFTRRLKPGQIIQPATLAADLVRMGYESAETVVAAGQFSRRGGILDIWPPAQDSPLRLDFFGDEIDSLRHFDPTTQRTTEKIQSALLTPAREFIVPNPSRDHAEEKIYSEYHLPQLHHPASLLDYLTDRSLVLVDDLEAIEALSHEIEVKAIERRSEGIRDGKFSEDEPLPYTPWSELFDALTFKRYIQLGPVTESGGVFSGKSDVTRLFSPNTRFGGRVKAVLNHMQHQANRGDQVVIVSRQSSRLQELWNEHIAHQGQPALPPIFIQGTLTDGFVLSPPGERRTHLLTDGEIFGWRRPTPRKAAQLAAKTPETAYADLQVGDWVVHVDYGIGRFVGLVHRLIDQMEREYLVIEYDNNDQLFVPVYQADRLTRYIGPDGREPVPTRLNSGEWKKARAEVSEAVKQVAEDLLDLYARRQVVEGYAFSPDGDWQRELEASFPYTETDDQLRVIGEVKNDMQNLRPMDRLICGDVGYGKTEVALRAAFKAVMDGKQVAILVPTTILAQQHFNNFRERLLPFPVSLEMLSRFRSDREQDEIIRKLGLGGLDIIIGTHRLLSKDVTFKDLGLLIIDEEQRFGVTHKERLKQMRTEVDVLTMTATPIPRTLYMALTGVRDISTINTPPEERLPIITHVGPYDQKTVRNAILRELERGGQVFFVHNRVQTIWAMHAHLLDLVPEARVGVAHGQMPEKELAQRMQEFTNGEIDILLSTSIIEAGLDIPNANTLIVDRADTFGLAQLYQLRGRVGRGNHQAYAYFLKHRKKSPTPEGRLRLETLAEQTDLGAGFNIAMRDLEIRGAGDFLGSRQHGHIAAVGFHLYTRLLAQAVRQHTGGKPTPEKPAPSPLSELAAVYTTRPLVNVDLPLPASIPTQYIPDRDTRLHLYRRIADLRTQADADSLEREFIDRFGPPPEEVGYLLFQIKVKVFAEIIGIQSVFPEAGVIVLRYPALPENAPARRFPYLGPDIRTGKNALRMPLTGSRPEWMARLLLVLQELATEAGHQVSTSPAAEPIT